MRRMPPVVYSAASRDKKLFRGGEDMKRTLGCCLVIFLCLSPVLAHTSSQDATQKQETQSAPATRQQRSAMHQEMMKSLQADLDSMRANLQKMKDQLSNVKDRDTKDELQLNVTMWQSLIDNIDQHVQAMKNMTGGSGMHRHGNMRRQHGHGAEPTPSPE